MRGWKIEKNYEENVRKKFWSKVTKDGPVHPKCGKCWIWLGYRMTNIKNDLEYGGFCYRGDGILAHRFSYIIHIKNVPQGLYVLHRCDNPLCVNPKHLFLGTYKDNIQDMERKGRSIHPCGEDNGLSKLTDDIVREIRRRYKPRCGINGARALAREFGVTEGTITSAVFRYTWGHVD